MKHTALILGLSMARLFGADKAGEPATAARIIHYHKGDAPRVFAQFNWQTIIVLPTGEKILDTIWGDGDNWIVKSFQGSSYIVVKPILTAKQTDVTVVTEAGNIYTYVLQEVSTQAGTHADIQVLIEPADDSMLAAIKDKPRFVSADALDVIKAQVAKEQEQREAERKDAERKLADAQKVPVIPKITFDYHVDQGASKLGLKAVGHSDKFTFLYMDTQEAFAIYGLKDNHGNLLQYTLKDGAYVIDTVVDEGYIQIGKKKATFKRES